MIRDRLFNYVALLVLVFQFGGLIFIALQNVIMSRMLERLVQITTDLHK